MTKTTREERNEIRLLEARATMGPWLPSESTRVPKVLDRDGGLVCECDTVNGTNDREAIAAMRNIFPDLLADLDAAEALHNSVMVDLAACVCRAEESDSRVRNGEAAVRDVIAQRDRAESELDAERTMRVEAEAARDDARGELDDISSESGYAVSFDEEGHGDDRTLPEFVRDLAAERDALKAKLAEPRRVVIHETEVVATKEEITSLKARLADLSEADEELHTCRAIVNATSENLSVDLERMVDDLAEANEKAARSEKDSHSWYELYEETKAKLAALVEAAHQSVLIAKDESRGGPCGQAEPGLTINAEVRRRMKSIRVLLTPAIAAARGGAS